MLDAPKRVLGALTMLLSLSGGAAAGGLPDMLGIQIGMPARDAYAKLQAQIPKNKVQVASTVLPTIDKPVMSSFASGPPGTLAIGTEGDVVTVDVTLPPNKQVVWRVDRQHFFPGKGILKTTLLASLREKYGKESRALGSGGKPTTQDKEIGVLVWLMDEQGRPGKLPPLSSSGVDPLWTCTPIAQGNGAVLVESPPPDYGNADRKWCLSSYTAVTASLVTASDVPELYSQMKTLLVSLPVAARAGEATMKWKSEISEGNRKQDIQKAGQQEKPKL
jgi:hypothetical protein